MGLCGITVNCIAGADCTLESFRKIPEADSEYFVLSGTL